MHHIDRLRYKLGAWSALLFNAAGQSRDIEDRQALTWLGARLFDVGVWLARLTARRG